MNNWQLIHTYNIEKLNFTGLALHQMAQYAARFGDSYLPKETDDSQNNLGWNAKKKALASRATIMPHVYMFLNLDRFCLSLFTDNSHDFIPLEGKTLEVIDNHCKSLLETAGLDSSVYKQITHYEITSHPYKKEDIIQKPDEESLTAWSILWSNAFEVLNRIQQVFHGASEIRIWPHHFDMGMILPIDIDESGAVSKSLGLGLALADTMINEPYFYFSYWSSDNVTLSIPQKLVNGGFMPAPDSWHGYVLPISHIIIDSDPVLQQTSVTHFFKEGITAIIEKLNIRDLKVNGISRL